MPEYIEVALDIPARQTFTYSIDTSLACDVGFRVEVPFRNRRKIGYVVEVRSARPGGGLRILPVYRVIDNAPLFTDELLTLARWISSFYFCSLGEALSAMLPGGKRESRLAEEIAAPATVSERLDLSPDQRKAVAGILSEAGGVYYVRGITGSGKTEVFLRAAEATLDSDRSVIYLVPEIALTHQLVEQLRLRFGGTVAVIHSRLTQSQRLQEWQRIARGDARFVVGARSAVFSPVVRLGLCIIDEEHESTYKSNASPRYHARQVAMKRIGMTGGRLIMGSATPSIEALHLITLGRIRNYLLSERLTGGALPDISIVDMARENGPLSRRLKERVPAVHREGRQTILFLNRRGFSYFFHCRSCGYEMTCRRCSITLTYHKTRERMLCHYCGYSQSPESVCPECGSLDVGYSGFGTQMIEETVSSSFPELRIRRIDADSVRRRGALERVLNEFRSGEIDLLLGTQMVAKGLNFPGVKLVGIVNADTGLNLPDFRAQERAFSLIVQVSGRAGRFAPDGEVIIQTFKPRSPAIELAARADVDGFFERESLVRKELDFPPFSRLVRVVFRGKSREQVATAAESWGAFLAERAGDDVAVLGPAECALSIISGNHRMHLLLRSKRLGPAHRLIAEAQRAIDKTSRVYVEIDVDPVSLL